jgi:hypothetical protein
MGSSGKTTAMTRFLSNILLEGKWMLRAITLFTAAATAFVCRSADARLWETKAEIDARYGKPTRTFNDADGTMQ